jgi:hypothetical protein
MSAMENPPGDFDGPWKATIELYLQELLAFCFSEVHDGIDWAAGYEWRDKDLQQAIPDSERASQTVDALVQVQRRDGEAALVLLHLEVQSQYDPRFHQRMFRYYARLYDRYTMPIVSLAILGDESPTWQPSIFEQALWGCDVIFRWPIFKLATIEQAALERDDNPCALVMLAHRIAQQTRRDPQRRATAKFGLLHDLYRRGYPQDEIERRYVIVDWLLRLPEALERATWQEIQTFKEEQVLNYVTSAERFAREEGQLEGRVEGRVEGLLGGIRVLLGRRFGESGLALLPELRQIDDPVRLEAILGGVADARTIEEVRRLLATDQQR